MFENKNGQNSCLQSIDFQKSFHACLESKMSEIIAFKIFIPIPNKIVLTYFTTIVNN